MNTLIQMVNRLSGHWFTWMMQSTFQGMIVLGIVLLILAFFRKTSPHWRYALLLVVLVKFIFPPVYGPFLSLFHWIPAPGGAIASKIASPAHVFPTPKAIPPVADRGTPAKGVSMSPSVAAKVGSRPNPSPAFAAPSGPKQNPLTRQAWIFLLFLAGVFLLCGMVLSRIFGIRKKIRNAEIVSPGPLFEMVREIADDMGLRRHPRVFITATLIAPQAGGVIHPFIILPDWVRTAPETDVRSLAAHEIAHIRRRDPWVNWFQVIVQLLLWWNPVLWWLNGKIRRERELCTDDMVIGSGLARAGDYSRVLVQVAKRVSFRRPALEMPGMADGFTSIRARVKRALTRGLKRPARLTTLAMVLLGLFALFVLPGTGQQGMNSSPGRPEPSMLHNLGNVKPKLVAISPHPSKPDSWWRPDGGIPPKGAIPADLTEHTGEVYPQPGEKAYEFLVKLENLPEEEIGVKMYIEPGSGTRSLASYSRELRVLKTLVPANQEICTLHVGIASLEWKKIEEFRGSDTGGSWKSYATSTGNGSVAFSEPVSLGNTTRLVVSHNLSDKDARVVAVDRSGNRHLSRSTSSMGFSAFRQVTFNYDIPLEKIEMFLLESRPFIWTDFRDISLLKGRSGGFMDRFVNQVLVQDNDYRLEDPAFRVLWFRDRNYDTESICHKGFYGYSRVARIALDMGVESREVKDDFTLTREALAPYDAVVFLNVESEEPLSPGEWEALREFIEAGGGVLVIGQQDEGGKLSREAKFANSVTEPFGIEFTRTVSDDSSELADHPVTRGLDSVPGGGSLLKVTSPASSLAPDGSQKSVLAAAQVGKGRLVAISDDSALADFRFDFEWEREKTSKYWKNILSWILGIRGNNTGE